MVNPQVMARLRDPEGALRMAMDRETKELRRREQEYQALRPSLDLKGKTMIVVDDGLATGATMHAAVKALQQRAVSKCIVAVPVASPETCHDFEQEGVEVIAVLEPENFRAVGQYYEDFTQTTD